MVTALLTVILAEFQALGFDTPLLQFARSLLTSPGYVVDVSLVIQIFRRHPFPTLILIGEVRRDASLGSLSLCPSLYSLPLP
jgi:hypothetical protein